MHYQTSPGYVVELIHVQWQILLLEPIPPFLLHCLLHLRKSVKLGTAYYPYRHHVTGLKPVPMLSIRGIWLMDMGFGCGRRLSIEYSWQRLVITVDRE